ncbi:MAG: PEP-CTERM sorting domain-containing protein [Planctomycetota bacterium]
MKNLFCCGVVFIAALLSRPAQAEIVFRIDDLEITQGTSMAALDVFISSDAADEPFGLVLDFVVDGGATFLDPPGEFDQDGFFNAGNFDASSTLELAGGSRAVLSLEFTNPALVPDNEVLLARLFVDSADLAPGNYVISGENFFGFDGAGNEVFATITPGTLAVIVPEPGTLGVLAVLGGVGIYHRRRRSSHP